MNIYEKASLGWKHMANAAAEALYLGISLDATRPVAFSGLVTSRCNAKCRYCMFWRQDEHAEEMTIAEWQRALLGIKKFVGEFYINFNGGEPFIKPGFLDLVAWCLPNGIRAGVMTNGSAMTRTVAARFVAAEPSKLHFSVDAATAEVHDYLRGFPGLFDKVCRGIGFVQEEQVRQGIKFPIVICPTISALNFRLLPALVDWAATMGNLQVSLQPVNRWSPETYDELWIAEADLPELEATIERLVEMQRSGASILTPSSVLRLIPDHFREKKAPRSAMPCRVGMRNIIIAADGEVHMCARGFSSIGNVKEQSAREIWQGALARSVRRDTVACEQLCLLGHATQESLGNKVKKALRISKNAH